MVTYTIAFNTDEDCLYACIPDGDDLEAALKALENSGTVIDRSKLTIEEGLILTDYYEDDDEVIYDNGFNADLTDVRGWIFVYAVRRQFDEFED